MEFRVFNLVEARFECTFGRGCDGVCCRQGRPPVYPDEAENIERNLGKLLPLMRPAAAALVERQGFTSRRRKSGAPMLRVVEGWCVFFNEGCVLHRAGAAEGSRFRYKPWTCAIFPLSRDGRRGWYVRQKGLLGEVWDLGCLDPARTRTAAADSLREEVALAGAWEALRSGSTASGGPSEATPPGTPRQSPPEPGRRGKDTPPRRNEESPPRC